MIRLHLFSLFALIFITVNPVPAEAYLLPLIGVGGVLITMLTGIFAAICAALFLVFYNVRRMWQRLLKKPDTENTAADHSTENPSDH